MQVDLSTLAPRDAYRWMIASVLPRPIAWISTVDGAGRPNLAPFSFFGGVTSDPPTVLLSVGRRKGVRKDTARNLLETREGVIHVPTRALAERMVATSADVDPDVDEFALAGLTKTASVRVRPPRILEAPLAMEARVERHLEVGRGPVDVFLLEILWIHADEAILVDGLPDPTRLAAVGRLGGDGYSDTSHPFHVPRPSPPARG